MIIIMVLFVLCAQSCQQSIAFLFRFRSAYAEMATGTHLQNWLKKEFQIGFEEEEKVE